MADNYKQLNYSAASINTMLGNESKQNAKLDKIVEIDENIMAFCDSNLNIGVYIDADGIHAKNILETTITEV